MLGTTRRTSVLTLAAALLLSAFCASAQTAAQTATQTPAGTVISNTAVFESGMDTVLSNLVSITVQAVCAPSLSPDGLSVLVPAGGRASFEHTLMNLGNSPQNFALTPHGAEVSRSGTDAPARSVTLDPGQSAALTLAGLSRLPGRGSSDNGGSEEWTLAASCASDPAGAVTVRDHVISRAAPLDLQKTLLSDSVTVAGADATYLLSVRNPNLVPLSDVSVTDALPGGETLLSAAPPATSSDAAGLHWTLGTLQPGEARRIILTVHLNDTLADDTLITNSASARSSDLQGSTSSQSALRIFSTQLLLQKTVFERVADVGDLLHYTVTVRNPSRVNLSSSVIDDAPSAGLRLIPGQVTLDGKLASDPSVSGTEPAVVLHFQTGPLPAGGSHTITYVLQITPAAGDNLSNTAGASAVGANGKVVAKVLSNTGSVEVARRSRLFGGQAEIAGRVYVDRSGSGHYVRGVDTPVPGARILLAGGQEALTDSQGRYHFADLTPGLYALRLDPGSAPWAARPWPGDRGLTGSRNADVVGLTNIDFPLQPNTGSVK